MSGERQSNGALPTIGASLQPQSLCPSPPCLAKLPASHKAQPSMLYSRSDCALPAGGRQCQMRTGLRTGPSATSSWATLTWPRSTGTGARRVKVPTAGKAMLRCLTSSAPPAPARSGGHLRHSSCRSALGRCGHLCGRLAGPCGLLFLPCAGLTLELLLLAEVTQPSCL